MSLVALWKCFLAEARFLGLYSLENTTFYGYVWKKEVDFEELQKGHMVSICGNCTTLSLNKICNTLKVSNYIYILLSSLFKG